MKNINGSRGIIFILFVLLLVLAAGCTSGKTQTRFASDDRSEMEEETDITGFDENVESDNKDLQVEKDADSRYAGSGFDGRSDSLKKEKFYETGVASWYGREFQGKTTASGEIFNMNQFTAAHKSLPFGTIIEVKNLENGKKTRVKINDRGPYRGNRILDLSYNAARGLDIISSGNSMVGITILKMGEESYTQNNEEDFSSYRREKDIKPVVSSYSDFTEKAPANYSVQAGAFYSENNARSLKSQIESIVGNQVEIINSDELYKVRVNGFSDKQSAEKCKRRLNDENISSFVVDRSPIK